MFENIINLRYPKYRGSLSLGYRKHPYILVSVSQSIDAVLFSVTQSIDAVLISVTQRIDVDIRYYKTKNKKNINLPLMEIITFIYTHIM